MCGSACSWFPVYIVDKEGNQHFSISNVDVIRPYRYVIEALPFHPQSYAIGLYIVTMNDVKNVLSLRC